MDVFGISSKRSDRTNAIDTDAAGSKLHSPRRKRVVRAVSVIGVGAMLISTVSACSSNQINPDAIGLYYTSGWYEGKGFEKVVPNGTDFTVNDVVVQLPKSQRSFIVRDQDGADVKGYISVASGDGPLINFEVSTAFKLNTLTEDIEGFDGGTLRKFYEDLCRHYGCDLDDNGASPQGWRDLLRDKLYPQLESAFKDEARRFPADAIVNNAEVEVIPVDAPAGSTTKVKIGALTYLQQVVGKTFQSYLERQTGQRYFCGPKFDRDGTDAAKVCGPVELLIISADYQNAEIRKSREEKKVATDRSAAQGELSNALKDPNYLEYLRIEAMKQCTTSAQAVCVFDASGGNSGVSVNAPTRK